VCNAKGESLACTNKLHHFFVFVSFLLTREWLQTLGVQSSVIILPTIGKALNIPDSRQQWIVSAYNLTFSCFLVRTFMFIP